jgi:hypothetical protein
VEQVMIRKICLGMVVKGIKLIGSVVEGNPWLLRNKDRMTESESLLKVQLRSWMLAADNLDPFMNVTTIVSTGVFFHWMILLSSIIATTK